MNRRANTNPTTAAAIAMRSVRIGFMDTVTERWVNALVWDRAYRALGYLLWRNALIAV
jgi:hypothetical protein